MQRQSRTNERQRGRIYHLKTLDETAAREAQEKRRQLQRRVERRAFEHRVLVEATELEKEIESRRCKLCDQLRAEAWGLDHTNWTERRCGSCWVQYADELARQRHSLPTSSYPVIAPRAQQRLPNQRHPPDSRPHQTARTPDTSAPSGSHAAATTEFEGVPLERVDDVIQALRDRDADRLIQLLDAKALLRHFATQTGPAARRLLGKSEPMHLSPPPEFPRGGYYYHDAVLESLAEVDSPLGNNGTQPNAGGLAGGVEVWGETATGRINPDSDNGDDDVAEEEEEEEEDDDEPPGAAAPRCTPQDGKSNAMQQTAAESHSQRHGLGPSKTRLPTQAQPKSKLPRQIDFPDAASELSFAHLSKQPAPEPQQSARVATPQGHQGGSSPSSSQAAGGQQGADQRPQHAVVADYRAMPRPLPSKPRSIPTEEAEIEAALRDAEHLVLFGRTQRQRSAALFYSYQLRGALADLRLLDRKARKAEAIHRHGLRLDTRDEEGVKRIIREGRRDKAPSPTTLRRVDNPDSFYKDPPKRALRWLEHIHPDQPDPDRAIDVVAWRPPSAKVPPPRHTSGMQAAGDWGEYRYDWDLARIRSMPVEEYLATVRNEKEDQSAWAELQARAHVLAGLAKGRKSNGRPPSAQ